MDIVSRPDDPDGAAVSGIWRLDNNSNGVLNGNPCVLDGQETKIDSNRRITRS